MHDNTAYIPAMGCSGFLVKKDNQPIGVMTAEHCRLRGQGNPGYATKRYQLPSGETLIEMPEFEIQTGNNIKNLQTVGTVKELLLPAAKDNELDLALGAFEGHTAEEVLSVYNESKLSLDELKQLKLGDKLYLSGMPVAQLKNPGALERQSFALSVLGLGDSYTTLGEHLKVLWAAVPESSAGAVCSFGNSGGEGFTADGSNIRSAGTLSAFEDFTGQYYGTEEAGKTNRIKWEAQYGVDLTGYAAVCGFAYKTPDANGSGVTVTVDTTGEILAGYSPDHELIKARSEFGDAGISKQIIDGYVGFNTSASKGADYIYVYRPMLFYEPVTNAAVFGWYDIAEPGALHTVYVDSAEYVSIYKDRLTSVDPSLLHTTGTLSAEDAVGKVTNFSDEKGLSIGAVQPQGYAPDLTARYVLATDNLGMDKKISIIHDQNVFHGK